MNSPIDIRQIRNIRSGGEKSTGGKSSRIWTFLQKDISFLSPGLPDKIRESFYVELSTMLEAGVDITTALTLIMDEQTKKKYKTLFGGIVGDVVNGATLSAAMKKRAGFTAYEYYSIQIGEETGKLTLVLKELAVFYRKKIRQGRQIVGALTYPAIVLVVAFGAVAFMMAYVVPMFADVLRRSGKDLPVITRMVLDLSNFIRREAWIILVLLAAVAGVFFSQRKKERFRSLASTIVLRLPIAGGIVRKLYLSRLSYTLSLLIASKIPIVQAIGLVRKMINFYPIEASLGDIGETILSGQPLYRCMQQHAIYPGKMIAMIKVGEEINQLELFFNKIAEQYSEEVEHQTNILGKFIEPFIILVLGIVVGVILIAMYLPLFKLGQSF